MNDEFEKVVEETNENVEAQTTEEIEEGIELTDTADAVEEVNNSDSAKEKEEEKPQGRYVTDEELNEIANKIANKIADKRVARKMSKLERDYENKYADYRDTEAVLNAGLGTSNIKEANERMREYYKEQGVNVPEPVKPNYSKHDVEILAKAEANEIIEDGYDAMLEEANRLANKGYVNLNDREKIIFTTLGDRLNKENDKRELLKLGASEEFLKDEKFISFRKQFNTNTPIKDVYDLYIKIQPKPKVENPGSMKNTSTSNAIKDFYTPEEASKFTRADYDKNPKLLEAVENSMQQWVK